MSIKESAFVKEMMKVTQDMWLKGWAERNGGNISYRLTLEEVEKYKHELQGERRIELFAPVKELGGECFLVTGSGKYFRNVALSPEENLAIIKIDDEGKSYQILWGLEDGSRPTSELPAHLLSHMARMRVTRGENRVIMHTHTTNLIALSYILELTTENITKRLWKMSTECLIVFPEGIGVIPWMVAGQKEIGRATAEKMERHSMILWPFHGVFGSGRDLDEAFGLIDTAEKAAAILVKAISMGGEMQAISDEQLLELAKAFNVKPLPGIL